MSSRSIGFRAQVERWLNVAGEFTSPPCVACGRGHASTDWVVGPYGTIHGRCQGCTEDAMRSRAHKPDARLL